MLKICYGNSVERLAAGLIEALSRPGTDPLAPRQVVVQQPELGRWLAREMAALTGVCANVRFELPVTTLWRFLAQDLEGVPQRNPLSREFMTLKLVDRFLAGEVRGPLAAFLSRQDELGCFAAARRLAALFEQYQIYRGDWLRAWSSGGEGGWQGELWRALIADERCHWPELAARWREQPPGPHGELHLFGLSGLAPELIHTFQSLGASTAVTLWLWSPCRQYWGDLQNPRLQQADGAGMGHPLLASLGMQLRDFFDQLQELDAEVEEHWDEGRAETRLQAIRAGMLDLVETRLPEETDRSRASIQVHACSGRRREVEVCRDRLLDLFEREPELQPHEVQVLAPDMTRYAPYLAAVFDSDTERERIPWRLVDCPGGLKGAASAMERLLEVLTGPLTAQDVQRVLREESVRRRFRIDPMELTALSGWLEAAGALRGDLEGGGKFSWEAAGGRLVLAAVAGEDFLIDGLRRALPLDGGDLDLLDRLLTLVGVLRAQRQAAQRPRKLLDWCHWLEELQRKLLDPGEEGDSMVLHTALARLRGRAELVEPSAELGLRLAARMLVEEMQSLGAGSRGEAGGVSFADVHVMRGVPCRVRYVLGLNAGEFPANPTASEADLIARSPRRGDRSRRRDDRQLFLEWLGQTGDCLLLSYLSRDERDFSALEPSPIIRELQVFLGGGSEGALPELEHPAQAFSERMGREPDLFTYRSELVADSEPSAFLGGTLGGEEIGSELSLADWLAFYRNPPRHFLLRALGMSVSPVSQELPEGPPATVGGLDSYLLRRELLDETPDEAMAWLRSDVRLPETTLGDVAARRLLSQVAWLKRRASALGAGEAEARPVRVAVGETLLEGTLPWTVGGERVALRAAKLSPPFLLEQWLLHLCSQVAGDKRDSWLVAMDAAKRFRPVSEPETLLEPLVALYREGQRFPLPLLPRASMALARKAAGAAGAEEALFACRKEIDLDLDAPELMSLTQDDRWPDRLRLYELSLRVWQPLLEHLES